MKRYILKALAARLRHGRSLFFLSAFGVALGVASVLCIQVINANAVGAFTGAVRAVSGESDLTVIGSGPNLDEAVLVDVLASPGVAAAWPLYRIDVAVADREEFFLDVIGVDMYAPTRIPWSGDPGGLAAAVEIPGWVAVTPELGEELRLEVGDHVSVTSGSRAATLEIGAFVDFRRLTPFASRKLVVMDIAQAQALFGGRGRIDQIEVLVDGDVAAAQRAIDQRLAGRGTALTPEARQQKTQGLLSAFSLNLTAMSLISVVVGFFLILSSTQASLVRRRAEFGLLRALGATRAQVLVVILTEIVILGLLGVLVGVPLGYWAAQQNIDVVSQSLSNIYLIDEVEHLSLSWHLFALAVVVGVGGAVAGALVPALDMTRRETKSLLSAFTLHERASRAAPALFVTAIVVMAAVLGWFLIWGREAKPSGFVLAFTLLFALPACVPLVVRTLGDRLEIRSFGLAYSLKSLSTRLHTSSLAIASLAIAISMMVGITLMIGSFRQTVAVWVSSTIRADVYITSRSWKRAGNDASLEPDLIEKLRASAGVEQLDRLRRFRALVDGERVFVNGFDLRGAGDRYTLPLLAGRTPSTGADSREAMVSEPFFRQRKLGVGDTVRIAGGDSTVTLTIAGVYYDYSPEGEIAMQIEALGSAFGPGRVQSLALYLDGSIDAEDKVDAIKALPEGGTLEVRSNASIRREVFDIFDQTFAITRILEVMGLLVATSGIALTLLVLARERTGELALYSALGARRRQIFGFFVRKGLAMTLVGTALGLVGGVILAAVLVFVINRAYFGWTIQPSWPWAAIIEQVVLVLAATTLASAYPALRASRTPGTELSRDDL